MVASAVFRVFQRPYHFKGAALAVLRATVWGHTSGDAYETKRLLEECYQGSDILQLLNDGAAPVSPAW